MAWGMVLRFSQFKKLLLVVPLATALVAVLSVCSSPQQAHGFGAIPGVHKRSFTQYEVASLLVNNLDCKATAVIRPKVGKFTSLDHIVRFVNTTYREDYRKFHPGDFKFECSTPHARIVQLPSRKLNWSGVYSASTVRLYLTSSDALKPWVYEGDALAAMRMFRSGSSFNFDVELQISVPVADSIFKFLSSSAQQSDFAARRLVEIQDAAEDDADLTDLEFFQELGKSKDITADSPEIRGLQIYLEKLLKSCQTGLLKAYKALEIHSGSPAYRDLLPQDDIRQFKSEVDKVMAELKAVHKEYTELLDKLQITTPKDMDSLGKLQDYMEAANTSFSPQDLESFAESQGTTVKRLKVTAGKMIALRKLTKRLKKTRSSYQFKTLEGIFKRFK